MKDEERVFYEDVREKAITARGAHNRNKRKFRAPNYTAKELSAMNGPLNSINLNAAMSYEEFKTLPTGLKKEYIQNLVSKYDAGPSEIARLLGMGVKNCSTQLGKLGFKFGRGHKQSEKNKRRMRADYGVTNTPRIAQAPTKKMTLQNISLTFSGSFDASDLAKQLSVMIPNGLPIYLSVTAEIKEGKE